MTPDSSVNELSLSARAANALYDNRVESIAQLTQFTPRDLLRFRNLGKNTVREIQAELVKYGFSLQQPDDNPKIAQLKDQIAQLQTDLRLAKNRADYFQAQLDQTTTELIQLKRALHPVPPSLPTAISIPHTAAPTT